jgi:hypothetical protein
MSRHSDFEKIFQAFIKHYGEKEGATLYKIWLSKLNLDDTKPYEQRQEKFSWTTNYLKYLKEDDTAKYFKCEALFPLTSMNNNVYSEAELLQATRSLIGKSVDWNHTDKLAKDVSIYDAQYEDNCSECLLKVTKDSDDLKRIESGNVVNVSVEADCLRGTEETPQGNVCNGLVFTGLALLTKGVLPGVPLTRIMPLEKIVESFEVTKMNEKEKTPGKTENPEIPKTVLDLLTESAKELEKAEAKAYDEFRKELDALKKRIDDVESKLNSEPEHNEVLVDNLPLDTEGWGDASFPDSCFAYVPDSAKGPDGRKSDRKLPYKNKDGFISLSHVRNALARLDQTQGILDAEKEKIRTMLQNILKKANPDYKPPKAKQPEEKSQCKCVMTKEGFWARFHELRGQGLSKSEAFRLVSLEVLEVAQKKQ